MEQPVRPAVVRLGVLARLTGAYVARLTGEYRTRRRRPGPPRRRGGEPETQRPVVALAGTCAVRTQAAGGYAGAVCLALPAPIQKDATHQERPAFRCTGGDTDERSMTVDQFAERHHSAVHDVRMSARGRVWQRRSVAAERV